jgi:hypothetical protein
MRWRIIVFRGAAGTDALRSPILLNCHEATSLLRLPSHWHRGRRKEVTRLARITTVLQGKGDHAKALIAAVIRMIAFTSLGTYCPTRWPILRAHHASRITHHAAMAHDATATPFEEVKGYCALTAR